MCVSRRKSAVKVAEKRNITCILCYRYRRDYHFRSDDETATISKIYDADFPLRESVREIHSHGQTSTQFSIGWHLSIIETLVFSFFSYRRFSPFHSSAPFRCLSRPSSIHPLFPFPKRVPENMHHTNKTTQAAQRISMPFLSYRRATNERTVHPSSAPFFPTIVFYPWDRAPPVSMLPTTYVISDCCVFRSITRAE